MLTTRKMRALAVGLFGMLVMAAAVSNATASTGLSITNNVSLATANGRLTLQAGEIVENCDVRLGIILNRSIAKRTLAQIGELQLSDPGGSSSISNCDLSSTGYVLNGITVGYTGFVGTLPNITGITAQSNNAAFLLQLPIIGSCLYTGTVPVTFNRNPITGRIETVSFTRSPTLFAAANCPGPGSLSGTLTVLATQPIITLI